MSEVEKQGERLAKRIARAGICSRRDAEKLITQGRVTVDGKTINTPAFNVLPTHKIMVDDETLKSPEAPRLWLYHKPTGLVTTHRDEKSRPTVFDALPSGMPRVISVGRLDLTSEGLLLLTNDGELARRLELPASAWIRRYRVRAHGRLPKHAIEEMKRGVTVEGVEYGAVETSIERSETANMWLNMALKEGKNREIRKLLTHYGLTVNRLIRVSYGPFQLGKLPKGTLKEVPEKTLREFLGDFFK